MKLVIRFNEEYLILKKTEGLYVFTVEDPAEGADSFYYHLTGEAAEVLKVAQEKAKAFSLEEVSKKLSIPQEKIQGVLKALVEMGVMKLPEDFPKGVRSDYTGIEKMTISGQDFSVAASEDNAYQDIYDQGIRFT